MGFHAESGGESAGRGLGEWTEIHAEDLAAGRALEMVMVAEAMDLVPGFARRQDNGADAVLRQQQLDRPVDRRDPNPGDLPCRARKNSGRSKRATRGTDNIQDYIALAGVALPD